VASVLNLFLAAMWLTAAALLFLWPAVVPGARAPTILDTGIPLAWGAVVLAAFNVLRWWTTRASARQRQVQEREARRRGGGRDRGRPEREPDPTFDFSEGPPPRKPEPPAGASG
jgi:hypothetical protein